MNKLEKAKFQRLRERVRIDKRIIKELLEDRINDYCKKGIHSPAFPHMRCKYCQQELNLVQFGGYTPVQSK